MNSDDRYYLSIHINREKKEHIIKMNMFIKMLNDRNIICVLIWKPFISPIYNRLNVSVEMKYKDELNKAHNDVYGF